MSVKPFPPSGDSEVLNLDIWRDYLRQLAGASHPRLHNLDSGSRVSDPDRSQSGIMVGSESGLSKGRVFKTPPKTYIHRTLFFRYLFNKLTIKEESKQ